MSERVLLADDHVLMWNGLRLLLEQHGFQIAAEAADGLEAVLLAQSCRADLALLDMSLPRLNGLDAARRITRVCPATGVIILAERASDGEVVDGLQDGVGAFVLKTQSAEELIKAMRDVIRGGIYVGPAASRAVLAACRAVRSIARNPLTPRERHILQLVAEGKTTKEAAALLGISVKTADYHRTRLMKRLGIHETAGLVRYAIRHGLIAP